MAHVDFKITTWERIEIEDSQVDKVKELIENGTVTSGNDLFDHIQGLQGSVKIAEVDEQMSVEENQGNATIELFGDDSDPIITNENVK